MEWIVIVMDALSALPDWLIFVPPALFIVAGVPLALLKRRAYFYAAALTGACGVLLCCTSSAATCYVAMHLLLALAILPLWKVRRRSSREERIYEKFREPLQETPRPLPAKVSYIEPSAGVELSHVRQLLDKLKREKLSPADRLEVEALSRAVEDSRGTLTGEEMDPLNDCLASALRLMAKYKM